MLELHPTKHQGLKIAGLFTLYHSIGWRLVINVLSPLLRYCTAKGSFGDRSPYFKGSARLFISKIDSLVEVPENPSTDRVIDGKHVPVKDGWNQGPKWDFNGNLGYGTSCQKKSIFPTPNVRTSEAKHAYVMQSGSELRDKRIRSLFVWLMESQPGSQSVIYENDPQFHIHRKREKIFAQGQTPRQICSI
jgi:hypothetical protein